MGAGPAWMRRGTRGHVAAPRGPAQRPRGAFYLCIDIIYSYRKYKGVFSLPYMGRVIPLQTVESYKPDSFINIFRVGLKTHIVFNAGDVAEAEALDRTADQPSRVDRVDLWTTDL